MSGSASVSNVVCYHEDVRSTRPTHPVLTVLRCSVLMSPASEVPSGTVPDPTPPPAYGQQCTGRRPVYVLECKGGRSAFPRDVGLNTAAHTREGALGITRRAKEAKQNFRVGH